MKTIYETPTLVRREPLSTIVAQGISHPVVLNKYAER